jgi:hypothetical protein
MIWGEARGEYENGENGQQKGRMGKIKKERMR